MSFHSPPVMSGLTPRLSRPKPRTLHSDKHKFRPILSQCLSFCFLFPSHSSTNLLFDLPSVSVSSSSPLSRSIMVHLFNQHPVITLNSGTAQLFPSQSCYHPSKSKLQPMTCLCPFTANWYHVPALVSYTNPRSPPSQEHVPTLPL